MALNFLSQVADFIGQSRASKAVKKYNKPSAAEQESARLYAALADPNSPLLRQFQEQEQALGMSNFLSTLRSMQNADRRQVALGRTPTFINPERADEQINFMLTRGMPGISALARESAMNRIKTAAEGINTNKASQEGRLLMSMMRGVSNAGYLQKAIKEASAPRYTPQDAFGLLGNPPLGKQSPIIGNK